MEVGLCYQGRTTVEVMQIKSDLLGLLCRYLLFLPTGEPRPQRPLLCLLVEVLGYVHGVDVLIINRNVQSPRVKLTLATRSLETLQLFRVFALSLARKLDFLLARRGDQRFFTFLTHFLDDLDFLGSVWGITYMGLSSREPMRMLSFLAKLCWMMDWSWLKKEWMMLSDSFDRSRLKLKESSSPAFSCLFLAVSVY
jgi:hypothetical protein